MANFIFDSGVHGVEPVPDDSGSHGVKPVSPKKLSFIICILTYKESQFQSNAGSRFNTRLPVINPRFRSLIKTLSKLTNPELAIEISESVFVLHPTFLEGQTAVHPPLYERPASLIGHLTVHIFQMVATYRPDLVHAGSVESLVIHILTVCKKIYFLMFKFHICVSLSCFALNPNKPWSMYSRGPT